MGCKDCDTWRALVAQGIAEDLGESPFSQAYTDRLDRIERERAGRCLGVPVKQEEKA